MPSTPSPFQGPPCLASYLFSIHTLLPSGAAPQTGRCFSWLCALYIYERCTRHLGIVTAIFTPNCNMLSTCPSPLTRLQVLRMDSVACSPTRQYTSYLWKQWSVSEPFPAWVRCSAPWRPLGLCLPTRSGAPEYMGGISSHIMMPHLIPRTMGKKYLFVK